MARRTLIINGVLLVAVVVLAVFGYRWLQTPTRSAAATRQTTTVSQGDITSTVSASGNVASSMNVGVSFNGCTGTVTSITVKPGVAVTVGQTLATLDPTNAQTAVATAQASLAQAQNSLANSIAAAKTAVSNAQSSMSLDVSQANTNIAATQAAYNNDIATNNAAQAAKDSATLQQQEQQLASTKLKDQQQVTNAQTQLTQAEASSSQGQIAVNTAQTAVTNAQANLTACTLVSPVAGSVITVNGTVGANPGSGAVAGASSSSSSSTSSSSSSSSSSNSSANGSSSTAASTAASTVSSSSGFITISDLTKLVLPSSVTESDIANVKVGDPVAVLFAALTDTNNPNGTTVAGIVSAVDLTSTVTSGVVTYGLTISLTSPPSTLRLGQSGTATITTSSKQNVLRLASNAITSVGRLKTVTVLQGDATQIVNITTGLVGNGETEIVSGLTAGQTVVLPSTTSTSTFNLLGGGGAGILGGGR